MRRLFFALLLGSAFLSAQDLKQFEKKVTEFTLPNGMHFIIAERHEAPVVSFHTYVNAGSADDPSGQTGIAHMFEHMAFKGTENIGTDNWLKKRRLSTRSKQRTTSWMPRKIEAPKPTESASRASTTASKRRSTRRKCT
jgi:predicted Zn-dependent peptidase